MSKFEIILLILAQKHHFLPVTCNFLISAHSAVVTNAIFAPNPRAIIKPQFEFVDLEDKDNMKGGQGEVLVSADYLGSIRVFINKFKPTP